MWLILCLGDLKDISTTVLVACLLLSIIFPFHDLVLAG
jgi:hypothetical protein